MWEDNITLGLQEMGCENERWMELAQGRTQWRTSEFCHHSIFEGLNMCIESIVWRRVKSEVNRFHAVAYN